MSPIGENADASGRVSEEGFPDTSQFPCSNDAVTITNLTRNFGSKFALQDVSFSVPRGGVFGLVGENGAGKTTLIKHILGLLRAQSGSVRVFGLNPVEDTVGVLGRIGYLSEQPDLPGWMRVDEFIRYNQAFYPKWDSSYAEELRLRFNLDPKARLKNLSKGQQAKAGLLAAQAHRPDLLLLDEPSSGLDPLVRRDILEVVMRTVAEEGRTVFFSSHLLEEIERVSDRIAMLHQGKLVLCGELNEIRKRHRAIKFRFPNIQPTAPVIPGALGVTGKGNEWSAVYNQTSELASLGQNLGAEIVADTPASLNDIFVVHAGAPVDSIPRNEKSSNALD